MRKMFYANKSNNVIFIKNSIAFATYGEVCV